ncbi:MAG: N5-glutamine methyltransferase family protein, partial [Bosea sp. (in: a-proteobacteria)]
MAATVTRAALLGEGRAQLEAAGIETPLLDARLLILSALRLDALALLTAPDAAVEPASYELARAFLSRRAALEPVARILGEREFRGLRFRLSAGTLEPRPDSEVVVEAALEAVSDSKDASLRLLDLGTGTGCLLLALLAALPTATGMGIDQSADALATARSNAALNDVAGRCTFAQGD